MRLWFGALLLAVATPISGQTIQGVVRDAGTDEVVRLASVVLIAASGDSVAATLTDDDGFFRLLAPHHVEFVLRSTALGYSSSSAGPFSLEGRDDVLIVEITLTASPLSIEGLAVESRNWSLEANGFFDRMSQGRGQFLTPQDIAASHARFTPELFHGLDHVIPQYAVPIWQRWVTFMRATDRGNCTPRIWIDGVWLRWVANGEGLDDVVPLEDVLAAEVYWGPFQAPMRYQGTTTDNSCGVVLIWTR